MTADNLRDAIHDTPFKAFTIHLPGNQHHYVPHPDFITLSGHGTAAVVTSPDHDRIAIVDIAMITQVVVDPLHVKNVA